MSVIVTAVIGSFFASFAFGILYNMRSRVNLLIAGLTGATGAMVYETLMQMNMNELSANLYGALAFSLVAELFAKYRKQPVTLYSVPGLIPLVPGGVVYEMMTELLDGNLISGLTLGLHAIAIAGMLVFGMMLVSSVFMMFSVMKKQVKKSRENRAITMFQGDASQTRKVSRLQARRNAKAQKRAHRRIAPGTPWLDDKDGD